MFDVSHKVDSSGWTTSITGKMRTTLDSVFDGYKTLEGVSKELFENLMKEKKAYKEKQDKIAENNRQAAERDKLLKEAIKKRKLEEAKRYKENPPVIGPIQQTTTQKNAYSTGKPKIGKTTPSN